MKIIDEDPIQRRSLPGHQFCEEISDVVVLSEDMMRFDPSEFVLELAHLPAICCHEGAFARGLLHDLVDDQLRVTADIQTRSAKLDCDAQSVDEGLIFCGIV